MFDCDDDLLSHRRQLMGCNVGSPRPLEGLTKEQKELLRTHNRNKSEEGGGTQSIPYGSRMTILFQAHVCHGSRLMLSLKLTVRDFVYYSRETAELRREIFNILQQEIPQSARINRERLLQRVQDAFEGRSTLSSETPNTESKLLLPNGTEPQTDLIDESIENPLHDSKPSSPLSVRQAHHVESFQSNFTQELVSDDFGDIIYWDNLPANNPQESLDAQMPLQLDFPLPLQADGNLIDGLSWDGAALNTV